MGVVCEVICNFDVSFGSWFCLSIMTERTSFVSFQNAFESSELAISFNELLTKKLPMFGPLVISIVLV